jgi:hypothetical protein
MLRRTFVFAVGSAVASAVAVLSVAGPAAAQTASGPTVSAGGYTNPLHMVNGQQVGLRAQNFSPQGVNHDDCVNDMTLQFSVSVSGFTAQSLQVWASKTDDCTNATARGIGASAATCWWVANAGILNAPATQTTTVAVRVQDIVGPQNSPPWPPNQVHETASACNAQSTFPSVPITLYFLAIDSSGASAGTDWKYQQGTDMIGPPAPTGVSSAVGETLFIVNWTPNADTDTVGYDVLIDPPVGSSGSGDAAQPADASCTQLVYVCPNGGQDAASQDAASDVAEGGSDAAASDAASDAASEGGADAGCHWENQTISCAESDGGTCGSSVLGASVLQDGSTTTTDDAGNVVSGQGGISQVPSANFVDLSGGATVSDRATGTHTITGLQDFQLYNVAVAAVDGYGNVGPASAQVCDSPAPVVDFWQQYRNDKGGAGGGFCTLEAVGSPVGPSLFLVGVGAVGVGFVRRRRSRS